MESKSARRNSRSDGSDEESYHSKITRKPRDGSLSPGYSRDRRRSTSRSGHYDRRRERRSYAAEPGEERSSRLHDDEDSNARRAVHREYRHERSGDVMSGRVRRDRRSRDRSLSRDRRQRSHRHRSVSLSNKRRMENPRSRSRSPARAALKKSRVPLPSQNDSFRGEVAPGEAPPPEKQKPNFKPTGLLAKEANTVAGTTTVLKYHEPPEGRKASSKDQWRMYIFKKKDLLDTVYLYQRSVWLLGRDIKITDIPLEHPSISKQHAVIQFRYITASNEYGDKTSKVKPYLIDLESTKGTTLNGNKIEASRYVELVDQDVVRFGDSEREYVMMLPAAEK